MTGRSRTWRPQACLGAVIGLALMLAPLAASAADPKSLGEFRADLTARLLKAYPDVIVTPAGETVLGVARPNGAHGRINLQAVYDGYLRAQDGEGMVEAYVATVSASLSDQSFVAVESLSILVMSPAEPVAAGDEATRRPLAGDRAAYLVFLVGDVTMPVTAKYLADLKLSVPEAWARAKANNDGMSPLRGGRLSTDGQADAVLGPNAFARLIGDAKTCPGGRGRIFLMLAGGAYAYGDPAGDSMSRFWTLARAVTEKPNAFSKTPITCSGGHWTVAPPPAG